MIKNKYGIYTDEFNTVTLITSGICNLNCKYCFIPKVPELKQDHIDVLEGFKEFKILDQYLEDLPETKYQIKRIEFWGGEPTAGFSTINENLDFLFKKLPNVSDFFFSTNLTLDSNFEQLVKFLKLLEIQGLHTSQQMRVEIQISIDGPMEINDYNRGLGTTKKIIEHYHKLLEFKCDVNALKVGLHLKPTLSAAQLPWLQEYQNCYDYIKFFSDNFYLPWVESANSCIRFRPSVPNFATPAHYTVQDGKDLVLVLRNFFEVSKQNIPGYEGWGSIIFGNLVNRPFKSDLETINLERLGFCGLHTCAVTLSQHSGHYIVCHRHFSPIPKEFVDERYDKNFEWEVDIKGFKQLQDILLTHRDIPNRLETLSYLALAKLYLQCNQISPIYNDEKKLLIAIDCLKALPRCLMVNYEQDGTYELANKDDLKLFLNGAIEELLKIKRYYDARTIR